MHDGKKAGHTQNNGKDVIAQSHHATVVRTHKYAKPLCVCGEQLDNNEQELELQLTVSCDCQEIGSPLRRLSKVVILVVGYFSNRTLKRHPTLEENFHRGGPWWVSTDLPPQRSTSTRRALELKASNAL